MKTKRIGLLSLLFIGVLFGSLWMNGVGYTTENSITDPAGDHVDEGNYSDILKVWVDNNDTFIMFKIELAGPWNLTMPPSVRILALISVDNATGHDWGIFTNFLYDYRFYFEPHAWGFSVDFLDHANGANDLFNGTQVGMAFYNLTNNNCTVEFGWKINTNSGGKGNLPLTRNQQLYLKFYAGIDSDFAPDIGEEPMGYIVDLPSSGGIPGFELVFVTLLVITIAALYREKLKRTNF